MTRFDLIQYSGAIQEYKPYKRKRSTCKPYYKRHLRPLVETIGISGIDLSIAITSIITVTLFVITIVRWWNS